MQNILGLTWSMVYILSVLAVATVVARVSKGASETSRKFVHILVGNWVFLLPFFTELWAVLLVPFSFIIINSLSLKYKLISAMERNDDSLGTVYYAISMFLLAGAGFVLEWRMLPYIGLLTMAYGDGFAEIIGKKWGKSGTFKIAPEKSILGSLTVGVAAFVITLASLSIFGPAQNPENATIPLIIFISVLTAVLAMFLELIGKKGCDNLSLPIGTGIFATLCFQFASTGFFLYLLISITILIVAYRLRSITLDGVVAAIITAATLYALAGAWLGASLLVFFILGSGVSKLENDRKRKAELLQEEVGARNWKQVLVNSLLASLLTWAGYIFPEEKNFLLLAFSIFAAASADTFSSEIGMLSKGKVFNILTGKPMESGLSGGISWIGLLAGLLGSILLALFAVPQFGWPGMLFIAILGFLGSIVDSILGASIQRKYIGTNGKLQDKPNHHDAKPLVGYKLISNNAVNLLSLALVISLGQLFYALFL